MIEENNFGENQNDNLDIDKMGIYELAGNSLKERLTTLPEEVRRKIYERVIKEIKETPQDKTLNNSLINVLPPDIRIKYLNYYDINLVYDIIDFAKGMQNEDDLMKVAIKGLNTILSRADEILSIVPKNKKIEFLNLISDKEKELNREIITIINVTDYIKQFDIDQRLDVIQNVIFKRFQIVYDEMFSKYIEPVLRFNPYSYTYFLKAYEDEKDKEFKNSEMFKTLEFFVEESKKCKYPNLNEPVGIVNIQDVVKLFQNQGYNLSELAEYLINSKAIENKVMFFELSDCLTQELSEKLYIKYCLEEKKFDYKYAITRPQLKGKMSSFDYLNILFKNLSKDELTSLFDEIKIIFHEMESYPEYDKKYDLIITIFSNKYNLDSNKVILFTKKFGYNFLKYLDNENIRKFIDTDINYIDKLFELFTSSTTIINKSVTNDVVNSLLQRQFMLEKQETYNIFSTFERLVQNNDIENIKKLIQQISNEYDLTNILKKNNCSLDELYNQVILGNLDLLHLITNSYIAYLREQFIKEKLPNVEEFLSMEKIISRESYKKDIIEHKAFCIVSECRKLSNVKFTEDQQYLLDNEGVIWILVAFKKNPKENKLDNKYKKYLKPLSELLDIMYDNKVKFDDYNPSYSFNKHLKFDFVQGEISNDFLIGILLEANYEGVMNVLSNDTNYSSLKAFLEKYKIIGWQDMFSKLMSKGDIIFDEGTVASLISNYDKIKKYVDSKSSLTSIIDYANCYSTVSSFYKILFGSEDYNLIAANAGRNKASATKYQRLNGCKDLVSLMYEKDSFTIPTSDTNITLKSGKNINIVVGNATNMMNLTYGERTESCMRKDGTFNSLFEHCITDKNGFHIRFVNPKTGNLISRVSGTRNGNTIFLNELRDSLDSEYSNEDLYEAIKMISEHLIQLSKESQMPIDNVIITSDYALKEHKSENQNLNLSSKERKEALRNIDFNFTERGILLASSNNEGKIIDYKFNEDVPNYDSIRDDIKTYYGTSAINRIIQIKIINDLINRVPIENISTEYTGEVPDYVISGEDFYIAYSRNNIDVYVIDSRKDNQRTLAELNSILKSNVNLFDSTISKGVNR